MRLFFNIKTADITQNTPSQAAVNYIKLGKKKKKTKKVLN